VTDTFADHCIIGAGFAGLPVARKLAALNQSFEILDRNPEAGGIWHKGVYETAHLISSKRSTQYPGFPMPAAYPTFPDRSEIRHYLSSYAETFGLADRTRFNCEVTEIRPDPHIHSLPRWLVTDRTGQTRSYRTVTLASGQFWQPRTLPHIASFSGDLLTSTEYQSPAIFRNKRVLVIGHGNTGADLAFDAARFGERSDISMRSGSHYFPHKFAGIPTSDLLFHSPLKFDVTDRFLARLVTWLAAPNPVSLGMPRPDGKILGKHPIVNTDFIKTVRRGEIKVRPEVASVNGYAISFEDGSTDVYDLIVTAIGHNLSLPMLKGTGSWLDWRNGLPLLYMNLLAPKAPGLFFAGFTQARTGSGSLFEGYGGQIARMATAQANSTENLFERLNSLKRMQIVPPLIGIDPIAALDMRSRGLGDLQRRLTLLSSALDRLGCPDANTRSVKCPDIY